MRLADRLKYPLTLALIAVGILVAGLALKPVRQKTDSVDQTERARLQELSRDRALADMAQVFARVEQRVRKQVVRILPAGPGGLLLGGVGQIVTAGLESTDAPLRIQGQGFQADAALAHPPVNGLAAQLQFHAPPEVFPAGLSMVGPPAGSWVVLVGRGTEGSTFLSPAIFGGYAQIECAPGLRIRVLRIGTPLHRDLAGAGVFDLEGALEGMVIRCNGSYEVIAAPEIQRVLTFEEPPAQAAFRQSGVLLEPIDAALREYLRAPPGLFVRAVRLNPAAGALAPGDVIISCNGQPADPVDCVSPPAEVEVWSRGRRAKINLGAPGIRLSREPGISIRTLPPDSPAAKAGLRAGDRLLEVDGRAPADLAPAKPHLVVVRRGDADYAFFVPGAPR